MLFLADFFCKNLWYRLCLKFSIFWIWFDHVFSVFYKLGCSTPESSGYFPERHGTSILKIGAAWCT